MNRAWLRRMIWSYIPIFLILFSFVFFMFFQTIVEQNKTNTVESSKVFTRQLVQSIDGYFKAIDQRMISEILNNNQIIDFYNEPNHGNVFLNYEIAKRFNAWKQEMPMIDSFYLVRYSDQFIYNGNLIYKMEDFEDREFVTMMENMPLLSPWTDFRAYREFSFQNKKDVISLVHQVPLSLGSKGLFVLNISLSSVRSMIEDMYNSETTFVQVYDRRDHPLMKPENSSLQREVLSRVQSDYTGWHIESGVLNGTIIRTVSTFSTVWFIFGIFIFIAGIASIVYVTRKNYKPLQDLIYRIDASMLQTKTRPVTVAADEFAFIESAIDNFVEQSKSLKKDFEESAEIKRKYLFSELVTGKYNGNLGTEADVLWQGWRVSESTGRFISFVLEIDNLKQSFQSYSVQDQALYKFILNSVTNEMVIQEEIKVWLEWTADGQLSGILFVSMPFLDTMALCGNLLSWVEKNLKFTVTIGLGGSYESVELISVSYEEALEALKFRPVLGNNRVIPYSETRAFTNQDTNKHVQAIHGLVDAFRLHEQEWQPNFHEMIHKFRTSCLSKDEITDLIRYFIYYMDLQLSRFSKEYYGLWETGVLPQLRRLANDFESLDRLEQQILSDLQSFAQQLAMLRKGRNHRHLIQQVRKHMEEQYMNPDLSLDYFSDKFEINAKYISQLFKEEFGENFLDYLTALRINRAKELLLCTDDTIQEVGALVGYVNAATFRRVFRRVEGIAPADFRRQHISGNLNQRLQEE